MKYSKKLLYLTSVLIAFLSVCSCGAEPVKTAMNYERPIITLSRAIDAMDSASYFRCFTEGAKQAYSESDNYNPDLVKTLLPSQAADRHLFKAKIVSSKELDEDMINNLEQEYKDKYRKRIDISKAQQMTVEFGTIQGSNELIDSRDLTAVRIENNWYIFGDVIESFNFGTNADNSNNTAS